MLTVYWRHSIDEDEEAFPREPVWLYDAVNHFAEQGTCREDDEVTFDEKTNLITLIAYGDGLQRTVRYEITMELMEHDEDGAVALVVLRMVEAKTRASYLKPFEPRG